MKGVAPPEIRMGQVYAAIAPFVVLKLLVLALIVWWPEIGTVLPEMMQ
jgi:TRAP-type mannitol/chloroaromatic compound transport system permease large subunit